MSFPALAADSVSIVVRGSFNPAIFSPAWLLSQELIGAAEYEAAEVRIIGPRLADFRTGWLDVTVTNEVFQVVTETSDEFERCRDVAIGVLQTLQHTPIAFLGINRHAHFSVTNSDEWHAIGDALTPKEVWDGILNLPGMRLINIQGVRPDKYAGRVHVQVEPSQLVPQAIFVSHNDHFALQTVDVQPTDRNELLSIASESDIRPSQDRVPVAVDILSDEWTPSMRRAEAAIERVAGLAKKKGVAGRRRKKS